MPTSSSRRFRKARIEAKGLRRVEPRMKPGAILATNTSSIPLQDLREHAEIAGASGGGPFLQSGVAHATGRGRQSRPGTRGCWRATRAFRRDRSPAAAGEERAGIFGQPRADALHARSDGMLDDKISKETIDEAAENFGMPMGPIELADTVGLDICLAGRRAAAFEARRCSAARAGLAAAEGRSRGARPQRPARAFMSGRTAGRKRRGRPATPCSTARRRPGHRRPSSPIVLFCRWLMCASLACAKGSSKMPTSSTVR